MISVNHIGVVVKEYRLQRGMTRAELAEDICTDKYIYLIERGERSPSTSLLRQLSDKLKVDLFEYYKFLDCIDPVGVGQIINSLEVCQRNSDFIEIERLVKLAGGMTDFRRKPWSHILKANQIACKVFIDKKYEEAIVIIDSELDKVDRGHLESSFVLSLYVLQSTCYQILGYLDEAKDLSEKIYKIIRNKYDFSSHDHIIVTGTLNLITYYYHTKEFAKAIAMAEDLIESQNKANSLGRIQYAFAFMAFSNYQLGNYDKAFLYFKYALFVLMSNYNPNDAYYIMSIDTFTTMAADKRMDQTITSLFFEMYE